MLDAPADRQLGEASQRAVAAEASALEQWWDALGWVDRTALGVLLLFFVVGLFRGLRWQVSRILVLLAAYAVTMVATPFAARPVANVLGSSTDGVVETRGLPTYLATIAVFVVTLLVVTILSRFIRRVDDEPERTPLGSRISGAGLGVVTGALVMLGGLSAVHILAAATGVGSGLVEAAEHSHARALGERALGAAAGALPTDLRSGASAWHELLRDGVPAAGAADAGDDSRTQGIREGGSEPLMPWTDDSTGGR